MKQYVIEVDDDTTLTEENIKGAVRVRQPQIPILNCYECKHLTYEDGGHLEMYAYCKLKRETTWTAQHWCSFGEKKREGIENE